MPVSFHLVVVVLCPAHCAFWPVSVLVNPISKDGKTLSIQIPLGQGLPVFHFAWFKMFLSSKLAETLHAGLI